MIYFCFQPSAPLFRLHPSIPYTQTRTAVKTSPSSPRAALVGIWPCGERAIFVSVVEDEVEDAPLFFPVEVDVP